jgi:hypothetical protein
MVQIIEPLEYNELSYKGYTLQIKRYETHIVITVHESSYPKIMIGYAINLIGEQLLQPNSYIKHNIDSIIEAYERPNFVKLADEKFKSLIDEFSKILEA